MFRKALTLMAMFSMFTAAAEESAVARGGKLWLQPSLFVGVSWSEVAAACGGAGGVCRGILGPVDVTGYRWTSYTGLIDFLQSYGAPAGPFQFTYEETGSDWAPEILADFHPTGSESNLEYIASWGGHAQGELLELGDAFGPQSTDYYEVRGSSGAASPNVGVLLWRDLYPRPGVEGLSVTPTRTGRYNVFGTIRNHLGEGGCALAMASGRCAFTCGPGSMRCEGGTAELGRGDFALFDLPTQPDGSIKVQVFVEGQVSSSFSVGPSQFGDRPVPAPRAEPVSFTAFADSEYDMVEGCFTLSADATRLQAVDSDCPGASSLSFEAQIGGDNPANDPGCNATISIRLFEDIPVNQGFSVTAADGATVSGIFRYDFWGEGIVRDANGCMMQWTAFSEDFEP